MGADLKNLWKTMVLPGLGLNLADFGAPLKKLRGANICIMQELSTAFGLTAVRG